MRPSATLLSQLSRTARPNTTAFIGLGRMGYEMANNLFSKTLVNSNGSASFVVCDAREESAHAFARSLVDQFPGTQVKVVTTPAEAILASSMVVTMLPSSPHVRQVYSQDGGIIPALNTLSPDEVKSTVCIDSTTLAVDVARQTASEVIGLGATMVDAPVSGGVPGAKAGTLSFMVGGTEDAFKRVLPILESMGKRIFHCGPSGAGLGAKICNNMVLGVHQVVVGEAMLLGQKLGLDPAVLAGVINVSTGACWASSVNNPIPGALPDKEPPCTRDYEGGFATALMLKDMGLATAAGESVGAPLPMGKAAEQIYGKMVEEDAELARKDFSSVYRYLEEVSEGKRE
ncbi:3-hydroxyisobutyrate dehydrogenase [Abortiporus biennis]|nr:3-hydroxyisobutyrate dehydrogenase [Abortiporus biennis]